MVLPRAMAFAWRKVSKAWKRLKVMGEGKTIAEAKIRSNKAQMKKSVKIALTYVFQFFNSVPALGDELKLLVLERTLISL